MRGNKKAEFYLYNSKINDNRVIIKVELQNKLSNRLKKKITTWLLQKISTVDALIYGHFGNLKTWSSQIMVVYENWLSQANTRLKVPSR